MMIKTQSNNCLLIYLAQWTYPNYKQHTKNIPIFFKVLHNYNFRPKVHNYLNHHIEYNLAWSAD